MKTQFTLLTGSDIQALYKNGKLVFVAEKISIDDAVEAFQYDTDFDLHYHSNQNYDKTNYPVTLYTEDNSINMEDNSIDMDETPDMQGTFEIPDIKFNRVPNQDLNIPGTIKINPTPEVPKVGMELMIPKHEGIISMVYPGKVIVENVIAINNSNTDPLFEDDFDEDFDVTHSYIFSESESESNADDFFLSFEGMPNYVVRWSEIKPLQESLQKLHSDLKAVIN